MKKLIEWRDSLNEFVACSGMWGMISILKPTSEEPVFRLWRFGFEDGSQPHLTFPTLDAAKKGAEMWLRSQLQEWGFVPAPERLYEFPIVAPEGPWLFFDSKHRPLLGHFWPASPSDSDKRVAFYTSGSNCFKSNEFHPDRGQYFEKIQGPDK